MDVQQQYYNRGWGMDQHQQFLLGIPLTCEECSGNKAAVRTRILLSTDLDERYVQEERIRILKELTIWNEMDKTDCYSKDIYETAHAQEYEAIPQKPKTYWEKKNQIPEGDRNVKKTNVDFTFGQLSVDERFEVAMAMSQIISRPSVDYFNSMMSMTAVPTTATYLNHQQQAVAAAIGNDNYHYEEGEVENDGIDNGDDDGDDDNEVNTYTSKLPYSFLYYAMLVREEDICDALSRANELYDRKRFWLLDSQVSFRKVYEASKVLGRDTLARWLGNVINAKTYPDNYLDQPIYYTFTKYEQRQLLDRIYASENEFVSFLLALRIPYEKLLEYESLQNPSSKAVYYYVYEQPTTPVYYIIEVAKRVSMKETIRNYYVLRKVWDVIRRNTELYYSR